MIGNPQVDLADQGSAYRILEDKPSGDPSMWRAGDTNSIEGAYYLAECYVSGKTGEGGPDYSRNQKGFPPNRPEAFKLAVPLYEKAAYFDYLPSLVKLSAVYANEKYAGKNLDKSLAYLIKAGKLGDKDSLVKLSSLYFSNFPGVSDENQKYLGMELLANNGNPEAQIGFSKQLIAKGSKDNFDKAKVIIVPLADKGSAPAAALLKEIESRENAARIQAEKIAAAEALQKENAEKLAAAESKRAADQVQAAEEQKQQEEAGLAAAQEMQRHNQMVFDWVFLIAGLAAIVTVIWCAIKAVNLSLNEEAVVFWGRRDLTISIIFSVMTLISFLALMVTLTTEISVREWWPFILISLITGFLLVFSIKRSFAANLRNRKKTFIVVVAKLFFSYLAVFCIFITYSSISNTLSTKDSEGRRKSAGDFARDALVMGFLIWCSKWAATGLLFLVKKNPLEDAVGGEPTFSDHNESRETQSDSATKIAYCYHVLELKSGASLDQIKKAWRDLVMVWHPDRFPNNEGLQRKAGERLKEINAAYEMLKQHVSSSDPAPT